MVRFELNPDNALIKYAHEGGAYIMDDFDPFKWLKITAGVRYSWFGQVGPYTQFMYGVDEKVTDSTVYQTGEIVKTYEGVDPKKHAIEIIQDLKTLQI